MKKLFCILITGAILSLFSCKKDEMEPAPSFVGKWNVQTQYLNVQTGEPKPEWNWNSNFELELNASETGFIRFFSGEKALEWDLIDGDQSIVLTGKDIDPSILSINDDSTFQAIVLNMTAQTDVSAEWITSKPVYGIDSLGNHIPYRLHWYLHR